jgi:hypothetical protein
MDAPRPPARPPGGAATPGPLPPPSAQPEPQRKSRQPDLFSFFRVASREEVEEQASSGGILKGIGILKDRVKWFALDPRR